MLNFVTLRPRYTTKGGGRIAKGRKGEKNSRWRTYGVNEREQNGSTVSARPAIFLGASCRPGQMRLDGGSQTKDGSSESRSCCRTHKAGIRKKRRKEGQIRGLLQKRDLPGAKSKSHGRQRKEQQESFTMNSGTGRQGDKKGI